ncbi:expressed unknown protein [Seminavis robusta]|uniref:Uncharacterized protein n=1 Tax=Seminavis robusta TaxID=568900 RepID=A0A9N8DNF7_9STRA|nr:expressed unknown protein [Seminavis robusta]|eukprot:Sro235_g094691.1  (208) ;mRNA; r:38364-38987
MTQTVRSTTSQLLVVGIWIIGISVVEAFALENSINRNRHTLSVAKPTQPTTPSDKPAESIVRYDLGIGKNPPFSGSIGAVLQSQEPSDIYDACQYLIEHEAVRDIPNPTNTPREQYGAQPESNQRPKTSNRIVNKPKIIYPKRSESVLFTSDRSLRAKKSLRRANRTIKPASVVGMTDSNDELDINTVWVEMLVHSEQSRVAYSATS